MAQGLRTDLQAIFACLSPARRRELGILTLLMPATALAEALTVATIVPFITLLSGQTVKRPLDAILEFLAGSGIHNPLLAASLLFAASVSLTAALRLVLTWISRHFAFAFGHEVSVEIQRRLLGQPYTYHLNRHSSEHLATIDKVDLLVFDVVIQGVQALSAVLIGIFILALLITIDPFNATLAFVLIGGFYAVALAVTRKRLWRHGAVVNAGYEQRAKLLQESIAGIRDLILNHSQGAALDRFRTIDAAFAHARARTAFVAAAPRILIEAAGLIIIAMLAILIAGRSGDFATALPFLCALALGALRLLPLAGQLYGAWASLTVAAPILNDVSALLSLDLGDEPEMPQPVAFQRSIEFDAVCFTYVGRRQRAIEGMTMAIPKGARVAVTGKTGSGKSTLADLLMGLIQPTEGRILIDGVPLSPDRLPGWRQLIAHVPQQIFLADESIAANIALSFHGGMENPSLIEAAADRAQLREFIESLPDGYRSSIGERGVRLSGGQRQRLALARALYKSAPILILDEPTSALDDETEAAVIDVLNGLQSDGTTIIVIAHRLSTVARCDPIFVLGDGKLIRSGSYSSLFGELKSLERQGEL